LGSFDDEERATERDSFPMGVDDPDERTWWDGSG
jgi:hypothetical protein